MKTETIEAVKHLLDNPDLNDRQVIVGMLLYACSHIFAFPENFSSDDYETLKAAFRQLSETGVIQND